MKHMVLLLTQIFLAAAAYGEGDGLSIHTDYVPNEETLVLNFDHVNRKQEVSPVKKMRDVWIQTFEAVHVGRMIGGGRVYRVPNGDFGPKNQMEPSMSRQEILKSL